MNRRQSRRIALDVAALTTFEALVLTVLALTVLPPG